MTIMLTVTDKQLKNLMRDAYSWGLNNTTRKEAEEWIEEAVDLM